MTRRMASLSAIPCWCPTIPTGLKILGAALIKRNQFLEALDVLEHAARIAPDDPQVYTLLGRAFLIENRIGEAIEQLERSVRLNPENAETHTQLGLSRLIAGDARAATDELTQALALDPMATDAGRLLALIHLRRGEFRDSITVAETLAARDRQSAFPYNVIGAARFGLGEIDAARAAFDRALLLRPGYTQASYNLARVELSVGNVPRAQEVFLDVLSRDENDTGAMRGMADVAIAENQFELAIQWLQRATIVRPDDTASYIRIVNLYLKTEQIDRAHEVARAMLTRGERSPAALTAVARAEIAAFDYRSAIEHLNDLSVLVAGEPTELLRVADLQLAARDVDGARRSLGRALAVDTGRLDAKAALVRLELEHGSLDARRRPGRGDRAL